MKKTILTFLILSSTIVNAQRIAIVDLDEVKPLLFENYIRAKDAELWGLYTSHTGAEKERMEKKLVEAMTKKSDGLRFDAGFMAEQQKSSRDRMKLDSSGRKFTTEFLIESGISKDFDLILFSGFRRNIAYSKSNPEDITQFLIQELIKLKHKKSVEATP